MKSTGIVRKIDALGRIVLPIELRKHMNIATGDDIEIFVDGNMIVLEKYEPTCIFCGEKDNLCDYENKNVCKTCRDKLAAL
ncbi:MAG: AbrB/MazE/SpoVT family DNA-binding domain-containing protein [Clostridia bacterium]|nr:AbrB/MazE/SpoVT family DNA-binding domain-containing protein [Clostridia bacterium]